ncbi:MAG: hypothetical protein ACK2UM_15025 [Anaerolineales bacterium]
MPCYRSHKLIVFTQSLILVILVVSFSLPAPNQVNLPITGREISSLGSVIHLPPPTIDSWTSRGQIPSLNSFVDNLVNGQSSSVRGVYVPGFMALPVVQQPSGNTGFVSQQPGTVTQFQLAAKYGVIGLLAHNYLAGMEFFQLVEGLKVLVVNGDGSLQNFRITEIIEYQKLTPGSNWSHYINLDTGERLTTYQVFTQYYQGEPHLIFQTCLDREGLETWGLRFVVAEPVET